MLLQNNHSSVEHHSGAQKSNIVKVIDVFSDFFVYTVQCMSLRPDLATICFLL